MILSVLMPVMESREWWKIHCKLNDQGAGNDIEILIDESSFESGMKRQALTDKSQGEYICHVDDDDDVSDDYIASILSATQSKPDLITFDTIKYERDTITKNSFGVSLPANHCCVWKRSIATQIAWCPLLGNGDDVLWYEPLGISGLVKTRFHIPKVLYHYNYDPKSAGNHDDARKRFAREYFGSGLRVFWRRGCDGLQIEQHIYDGWKSRFGYAFVRNNRNAIAEVHLADLHEIGKIKLA